MDMEYDEMSAATPRETMLLKAMVLPMLIRDRRTVMTNETMRLLRGIGLPEMVVTCKTFQSDFNSLWSYSGWRTLDNHPENGRPRSRENAHICRDAVATLQMQPQIARITRIQVMIDVPAWEPVTA
jgi:hypothetical protein